VLAGKADARGPEFVFAEKDVGPADRGLVSVSGELTPEHPVRYYHLAPLTAGQTFYAYAEVLSGDLRPVLSLHDFSDKAMAYGNYAATDPQARLQYVLPRRAEGYRLGISGEAPSGKTTRGAFRLLIGLNAPEVLRGEGEPAGIQLLQEPIPVRIGVKLHQITEVDQKSENYGVVAELLMLGCLRR
jgi:hypothetical protein